MKKGGILFSFTILLVIIFLSLTSAITRTCYSCDNCTAEISNANSNDIVQLNQSLSGIVVDCITFGKSNITFDCQNNSISGDSAGADNGISLTTSKNNVIENCNLSKFYYGIYMTSNSNNNNLTNIISNSNTKNGIDLEFSRDNIFTNSILSFNQYYGIYLFASHNNTINNLTAQGAQQYGVYFKQSNNNILSNIIASSAYDGIYLELSDNNTLNNLTTNSNYEGILISSGKNNTLTNVISNSNQLDGIWITGLTYNNTLINLTLQDNHQWDLSIATCNNIVQNINGSGNKPIEFYNSPTTIQNKVLSELILCGANNSIINNVTVRGSDIWRNNWLYVLYSDNVTISNINSSYNYYGVYVSTSSNLSLINITANNNARGGIGVESTTNSTFNNLISKNNLYYGVYFYGVSTYNTMINSFIQYNTIYGLYIQGLAQNNTFYNNYFNNSAQYYNTTKIINFFNTTKTLGTNIVGGAYIGGNYWAALNGTGFSQTCTLSTNGICDTSYSLDGLNYDYLPLTCTESWSCGNWQTCQLSGTQTRTCTDTNFCQTYKYKPAVIQTCDYSQRGITPSEATVTQNIGSVSSGGSVSISIRNPGINLVNVTMNVNKDISSGSFTVSNTNALDSGFSAGIGEVPFGLFYQAFHINTSVSNNDLNNVSLEFRVNQTWLEEQNHSYNDVILYRIPNENVSWQTLDTTSISNDSQYYYFTALSPGFSTFVVLISQTIVQCTPTQKRCFNNELQSCSENSTWITSETCKYGCEGAECKQAIFGLNSSIIYYGILGLVAIALIIVLFFVFKRIKIKK